MFRIICKFEPNAPTICGEKNGAYQFRRGGWRVVGCHAVTVRLREPVDRPDPSHGLNYIGVMSPEPRLIGTRVNPFKLLKQWQEEQRQAAKAVRAFDEYAEFSEATFKKLATHA